MEIHRFDVSSALSISTAVIHGDVLYLSGFGPDDLSLPVRGQAMQIFAKIDHHLGLHGTNKSRLLQVTAWLRDIESFKEWAAAWNDWVDAENPPVRATVGAQLADPSMLVEVMVTAAL